MSRKKRMQSLAEAKDRRMKKIAIGLSVVLVAVLAFEVPKMMHSGGSSATPPPATTTTPATPTAGATTTATATSGTAVAAVSTTSTKLPNSDAEPQASKSTLYSFNRFADKDPFAQQISATSTTGTTTTTTSASTTSASSSATSTGSSSKKQQPSRTLAATGVRISINGAIQTVRVGSTFPSANPLFRLVGDANGIARIAIANGSYASGAHTVSLSAGRTLTLVDTADSIRYKIRLLNAS